MPNINTTSVNIPGATSIKISTTNNNNNNNNSTDDDKDLTVQIMPNDPAIPGTMKYDDYDVWREIGYYTYVREKILKPRICPNFALFKVVCCLYQLVFQLMLLYLMVLSTGLNTWGW